MKDIDDDLRAVARQWREDEPPPPDLLRTIERTATHRTSNRGLLSVASVVVVVVLIIAGAALAIAHRAGTSRPASGANQAVITGTLRLAGGAPSLNLTGKGAIPGTVFVYGSATYEGPPITSVTTNSKGRYRVRLPPGIYYLAATSPRYRINPRPQDRLCQTGPVNATAGTTKKDVECNMK